MKKFIFLFLLVIALLSFYFFKNAKQPENLEKLKNTKFSTSNAAIKVNAVDKSVQNKQKSDPVITSDHNLSNNEDNSAVKEKVTTINAG